MSAAELRKAQQEQREGIEGLQDWYTEWAVTFREIFNVRAQIQLGLTTLKRNTKDEGEADEATDEGQEEAEDAEEGAEEAEEEDGEG